MANDHVRKEVLMPEETWDLLERLGREFKIKDGKKGAHSQLIREMVLSAVAAWRESPYICLSARHLIFITRNGELYHRQIQDLKLNTPRKKLPCMIEMKPEKRRDFLSGLSRNGYDYLRSKWILNHFAAWYRDGEDVKGDLRSSVVPKDSWRTLASYVDQEGAEYKMADLTVEQEGGRYVTREVLIGLEDYMQWNHGDGGYDRIELAIDIPTRNLEVVAIVDAELYRNTPGASFLEIQELGVEFRNREGALFDNKGYGSDPDNLPAVYSDKIYLKDISEKKKREEKKGRGRYAQDRFTEMVSRIKSLAYSKAGDSPVLMDGTLSRLKETLKLPAEFLLFEMAWPSPPLGLEVCVRWQKPVCVHAGTSAKAQTEATTSSKRRG